MNSEDMEMKQNDQVQSSESSSSRGGGAPQVPPISSAPPKIQRVPPVNPVPASAPQMPRKSMFPNFVDTLAILGIVLLASIVSGFFIVIVNLITNNWDITTLDDVESMTKGGGALAFAYLLSMVVMIVGVMIYRSIREGAKTKMRLSKKGFNPLVILWGVVVITAAGVAIEPLMLLLPQPAPFETGFWTFAMVVILAPVLEEILCRGLLLEMYRSKYGVALGILISSLIFGVIHGQILLIVNATIIGLVLGTIYVMTSSIWSVMILHAINNALAYTMMHLGVEDTSLRSMIDNNTLYHTIYVIVLALFIFAVYRLWTVVRKLDKAEKLASKIE